MRSECIYFCTWGNIFWINYIENVSMKISDAALINLPVIKIQLLIYITFSFTLMHSPFTKHLTQLEKLLSSSEIKMRPLSNLKTFNLIYMIKWYDIITQQSVFVHLMWLRRWNLKFINYEFSLWNFYCICLQIFLWKLSHKIE